MDSLIAKFCPDNMQCLSMRTKGSIFLILEVAMVLLSITSDSAKLGKSLKWPKYSQETSFDLVLILWIRYDLPFCFCKSLVSFKLKFRFSVKTTKIWHNFPLSFGEGEDCAKFLGPSQNIWTLAWLPLWSKFSFIHFFFTFFRAYKKIKSSKTWDHDKHDSKKSESCDVCNGRLTKEELADAR